MKTVKQWFKEGLNKEDYEKAEKYESENWDWKAESFEDALLDAFTWDKTDEGWNYWDKIFSNGGSLQPDLNTQDVDNNGWIDAQKEQPLCISTGNWDGKQSDIVLAETVTGKKFLAQCYEGFMDGSAFFDWCQVDEINSNEWLVNESVSRWMKIPF